jgi:hypothetical protein
LRLLAADKTNLTLPESLCLYKRFGAHRGSRGLGPICVELCCLFDLISRAPLRFVYARSSTSEHSLIPKLISLLKKGDLLLLDSGFYSYVILSKIIGKRAEFIIPLKENVRPKVLRKVDQSDYICQIQDPHNEKTIDVRVVFVYRDGFRRRRLVTSLLDPINFPASELAQLYHLRWGIETFYRDFKCSLRATSWHCQTPESFDRELLMHMIVCCLIRLAMLGACRLVKLTVEQLSFTRALTETRLLLRALLTDTDIWASIWETHLFYCARYRVRYKPGRQFSRDRQEYRRKSRRLEKPRKSNKRKYQEASPLQKPETRKGAKEQLFLLS